MTSLLACKNVLHFSAEHPNQAFAFGSVRFGSVRKCHVRRTFVRFGGSATALVLFQEKKQDTFIPLCNHGL